MAILAADNITDSMVNAISETNWRLVIQQAYNEKNGAVPTAQARRPAIRSSAFWSSHALKQDGPDADLLEVVSKTIMVLENDPDAGLALEALPELIDQLETKMKEAAKKLDFEEASNLSGRLKQLHQKMAGNS